MDPFSGITVQIRSNGHLMDFYDDPDADETGDSRTRQRYVEAVPGNTFQVKVMLTNGFDLYPLQQTDGVKVRMSVDESRGRHYLIRRETIERSLLYGNPRECDFTSVTSFCQETQRWVQSDYSFGALDLKESTTSRLSSEQFNNVGTIRIEIQRMRVEKRSVPKDRSRAPETTIKEISEKALKGKGITSSVCFTNDRPVPPPSPIEDRYFDIPGSIGMPLKFTILYRSKTALQMLGCIPRSPSPAVEISDVSTRSSPARDMCIKSEAVKEEMRDLRARLALLERASNVKNEPIAGVKRERGEGDDAGPQQRRRKSGKIETIDLTDD